MGEGYGNPGVQPAARVSGSHAITGASRHPGEVAHDPQGKGLIVLRAMAMLHTSEHEHGRAMVHTSCRLF